MKEQITEKMLDKILDYLFPDKKEYIYHIKRTSLKNNDIDNLSIDKNIIKKELEENGYIKQSREKKIRKELKRCASIESNDNDPNYKFFYKLALELIEILDNKIKELKGD